ncbi:MAG: glutamate-5-semialdehyde dehydrogenase [Armatimonadota bacterium]
MTEPVASEAKQKALKAREAAAVLAGLSTAVKDAALLQMASALLENQHAVLDANAKDVAAGRDRGLSEALVDRLSLNPKRIEAMAEGLRQVASLPDPVGSIVAGWTRPNGLVIQKVRVPLGVVGCIYEARPNVTVDVVGLCLKSGNATVLRGGSEAINSNTALVNVLRSAAAKAGVPEEAIQLITSTDRAEAQAMMRLNGIIDVLIPRGGAGLIRTVVETATVPVIETGVGNCHTYVDASADLAMAEEVAFNAKVQRCSVCNAMETLLVHRDVANVFLPRIAQRYEKAGVELRGCPRTREILPHAKEATEEDWYTEYLALILAVKVVDSLEDAIAHINKYGSKHSEAIITNDYSSARRFTEQVDAAAVYVNASTRFTDGFEFGMGAEVGISTQKLHARGPMGLEALTSTKFVVWGDGQIRQ